MMMTSYEKFSWDQHLARILVRPFVNTRLTPNHVTSLSLVLGVTGGFFFAFGGDGIYFGSVLYAMAMLADHADGELARMSGKTSVWGHYYDYITDGVNHTALFVGMGIGLEASSPEDWPLYIGLVAGVSVAFIFLLRDEIDRRFGKNAVAQPRWAGFDIEDVMYLVIPIVWIAGTKPLLIAAGVGAPIFLLWQFFEFLRLKRSR